MPIGLICAILTIIIIILISIFNNKTKKVFSSYYFYLAVSVIGFLYFFIFRWISDLKDWINNNYEDYVGGISVVKSKVLLLDMCPFLAVFLPIMLMIDKNRNWIPSVSYFGIVGGGITIFGQIMFEKIGPNGNYYLQNVSWWEYMFFNKLYFIMHFYIFVLSFLIVLNSKSLNWQKIMFSHIYAVLYFLYVTIIIFSLDVNYNATGLVINDWLMGGQYEIVGQIFNLSWPWQPIVCFILVWIWIIIMMMVRNILVIDKNNIDKKHIKIPYLRDWYMLLINKIAKKIK